MSDVRPKRSRPRSAARVVRVVRTQRSRSREVGELALAHGFADRTGYDEDALADLPVLDPAATVRTDVERVLSDPRVSPRITVSGDVYDVDTGLVTTIVEPVSPTGSPVGLAR